MGTCLSSSFQVDLKVSESQGGHNPTILILSCPSDDGLTEKFVFIAVFFSNLDR